MKYLQVIVLLVFMVVSTMALQCYNCDSSTNTKCGEEFEEDDNMKMDCSRTSPSIFQQTFRSVRNATGCVKKTMEPVNGRSQIIRSCYFGDVMNTKTGCESDPSMPFVSQLSCDVCTTDLCNSSTSHTPLLAGVLAFFFLARLLA